MLVVRRWRHVVFPLAAVLILMLGVFGCGNGEEETVDESNGEEEKLEINGEEKDEVIDEDKDEKELTEYRYQFGGSDTVDGVETKVAVIEVDGDEEIKIWKDVESPHYCVQMEIGGEKLTGEEDELEARYAMIEMSIIGIMSKLESFSPWNMVQGDEEGTEVRTVSSEVQQFGDREAEITHLEIKLTEPHYPFEEMYLCSVADFDGEFQLPVSWEFLGENGGTMEGEETPMEITSWPVPRDMFELVESYELLEWKQGEGEGFIDVTLEITKAVPR